MFKHALRFAAIAALSSSVHAWERVPDLKDGRERCGVSHTFGPEGEIRFMQAKPQYDEGTVIVDVKSEDWAYTTPITSPVEIVAANGRIGAAKPLAIESGFAFKLPIAQLDTFVKSKPAGSAILENGDRIATIDLLGMESAWEDFNNCRRRWAAK